MTKPRYKMSDPSFQELERMAIAWGMWFAKDGQTWIVGEVIYSKGHRTRADARREMVETYLEIS